MVKVNKFLFFEVIFVTLISSVVFLKDLVFNCPGGCGLDFDSQSFIYWNFLASTNLLPYKDFFYPYGIIFFLKSTSQPWMVIYFLSFLTLFYSSFLGLKTLFKNNRLTYPTFIFFCIFVLLYFDVMSFVRYSPLIVLSIVLSYLSTKGLLLNKKALFVLGLFLGLIFSFITDLIFYCFALTALFYVVNFSVTIKEKSLSRAKELFEKFFYFIGGLTIGFLPLVYYLTSNSLYQDFLFFMSSLKDIALFAKTPFPHSLRSTYNVFTFGVLIVTIFDLLFSFFFQKKKNIYLLSLRFLLFSSIILLLQKSIIRSIEVPISLVSFFLLLTYIYDYKTYLVRIFIKRQILISVLVLLTLVLLFLFSNATLDLYSTQSNRNNKQELVNYKKVVNYFQKKNVHKIFSFPGDPVFYVLLNQLPPYYPSIYEATPLYAQKKQIDYLKKNKIQYVVYNTRTRAIQDGVPDFIRGYLLHSYIIKNYFPIDKIGDFLILEKDSSRQFFNSEILRRDKNFRDYLLNIDFKKMKIHYDSRDSDQPFLEIKSSTENVEITIESQGNKTKIKLEECFSDSPCIIPLALIPLFSENYEIKNLEFKGISGGEIRFIEPH